MAFFQTAEPKFPPLPSGAVGIVIPPGIGDGSWLISKTTTLAEHYDRDIYVTTPSSEPQRSHQLFELLSASYRIKWGGYSELRTSDVLRESKRTSLAHLEPDKWNYVSVNEWLEQGKPLVEWELWLPCNYHYELDISPDEVAESDELRDRLPANIPRASFAAIYTSNRQKDKNAGWALWSTADWFGVIERIYLDYGIGFILLGAEYDTDRTNEVAAYLGERGVPFVRCLGRRLGVALTCLSQAKFSLSYASGLGVLSDVLNVPGVMLLPHCLRRMERAYADPANLDSGRYRAWTTPTTAGVLKWVENFLG